MTRTSAYQLRIKTDSSDENGILLLVGGELVAILVELADESHGEERGNWIVEATFGVNGRRVPAHFPTATDAADWISEHICQQPFMLGGNIAKLS